MPSARRQPQSARSIVPSMKAIAAALPADDAQASAALEQLVAQSRGRQPHILDM